MRDATYHRATLDSLRQKLPHPERYRVVLGALLTLMFASGDGTGGNYTWAQYAFAAASFLLIVWLLVDYASVAVRTGLAVAGAVLIFAPAIDSSSDITLTPGFVAIAAAVALGALTAIIDRLSEPSSAAIHAHALRDIRSHA